MHVPRCLVAHPYWYFPHTAHTLPTQAREHDTFDLFASYLDPKVTAGEVTPRSPHLSEHPRTHPHTQFERGDTAARALTLSAGMWCVIHNFITSSCICVQHISGHEHRAVCAQRSLSLLQVMLMNLAQIYPSLDGQASPLSWISYRLCPE